MSNKLGSMEDGAQFKLTIQRRYGHDITTMIEHVNRETSLKITTEAILSQMGALIHAIGSLKHKPDYYERVSHLYLNS